MQPSQPSQHTSLFHFLFGTTWADHIIDLSIIVFAFSLLLIFMIMPVARIILDILDHRRLRGRQLAFLEITPPALSAKTPLATAQLDAALHGLLNRYSFRERKLRRKHILSLECVSTRDGGIRFIAALSPHDVELFKQIVISYLSTVRFRQIDDYLSAFAGEQDVRIAEFAQSSHFAYPLAAQETLTQHDPIAYITGAMARPLPGELSGLQLVFSPAHPRTAAKVRARLMHGQDPGIHRVWWHWPFIILGKLIKAVFGIFTFFFQLFSEELSGSRSTYQSRQGYYQPKEVHPYTQHVLPAINTKLDQPLFNVEVRAIVIGQDSQQRMQGLANSLYQFHVPGYQGLRVRRNWPVIRDRLFSYRLRAYRYRLPAKLTTNSNIFAASELASLYHFPYKEVAPAENLVQSLSRELPAPLAMKQHNDNEDYSVIVGLNSYHGNETYMGLTEADREKHVYVIGGTGNGKTTLLQYAMLQDIQNGKGMAFIDPHGDAAQTVLRYIPKSRHKDVIYLNPLDIKYPVGINLLELPEGLDEDELLIEQERVTEAVVSVLRKVFADDDANAHRIEAMLRNAILTAFTIPDATLFTILKLLRNAEYRKEVVAKLENEYLKDFWREEFGQAGGMQRVSMSKGLTHRIDRFQASAPAYRMFSQVKSTISFEDIMNEGKILICNFSTEMGEDTSTLFGTTVLAKLKIAAERRARMPERERRPFYVYVDEFQNFATTPFVKMLSASRKYKLFLTIAEQSTAQQEEDRLTEAILANVSTVICFRTGSPADERLILPWFTPYIEPGEIGNLPAYHFYLRTRAAEPMEPVSGETLLLEHDDSNEQAQEIIMSSRKQYAVEYVKPKAKKQAESSTPTKHPHDKLANRRAVKHQRQKRASAASQDA